MDIKEDFPNLMELYKSNTDEFSLPDHNRSYIKNNIWEKEM